MDNETLEQRSGDDVLEGSIPGLKAQIQSLWTKMNKHPPGSLEYNLARRDWSQANADLASAEGRTTAESYLREATLYGNLVEAQQSSQ